MIIRICDGCRRRIAEHDTGAALAVQMGEGGPADYCGACVTIIRTELPRLAAQARDAAATFGERMGVPAPPRMTVQQRARSIWPVPRHRAIHMP